MKDNKDNITSLIKYIEEEIDKIDFAISTIHKHIKENEDIKSIYIRKLEHIKELLYRIYITKMIDPLTFDKYIQIINNDICCIQ